jgi:methyltransferase (TIGR00027 family)
MIKMPLVVSYFISTIILILGVTIMDTSAVEPGKISRTAKMTAIYRAIGALETDEKIRNSDTYAEKFMPLDHWNGVFPYFDFHNDYESAIRMIKADIRFSYSFVQARTKHIDAILTDALKNGATQVVNLGAGYDSRAYRFHQAAPAVKYFEIDMPEMIADKKERVKKVLGELPGWVTYVSIDFSKQTLSEELIRAGYDKNKKTLFIWEGVTMYIPMEAVVGTLQFIAGQSAPGSAVVLDYVSKALVDMKNRPNNTNYGPSAWGEPIIFGIEEGRVVLFITQVGLKLISDLGPLEMTNRYLIRTDCQVSGYMHAYTRIAHALVVQINR